jgi:hypothetical protein
MFSGSVTFFGQAKENCCAMAMSMSFGTYTSAPAAPSRTARNRLEALFAFAGQRHWAQMGTARLV